MSTPVAPFSLKDAPALIERLLPVQKLSAEAYKEQMAGTGKTLTALGSYWKGRKPLILNRACILGCLLPATDNRARDLEIFEKLMAMDDESFVVRWPRRPRPKELLATLSIAKLADYFTSSVSGVLPESAPVDWSTPGYEDVDVVWREDVCELERRRLEAQMLPKIPYRELVEKVRRPEEVTKTVHDHIWPAVNEHLGTSARSFPELVEQLGTMRFGHRPRVADTFCGSGQIPFEAARLGCDVYASDLNPVTCMLTWGGFNLIGGSNENRAKLAQDQQHLVERVQLEIDRLRIETDGRGWRAKAFLYCVEVLCPQSGWLVPLIPSLAEWQAMGWTPDMRIEVGGPPRYQGLDLIRARGWTHWHHLFNPRQLLVAGLVNQTSGARLKFGLTKVLNWSSRLSIWGTQDGGGGSVKNTFMNQALNTQAIPDSPLPEGRLITRLAAEQMAQTQAILDRSTRTEQSFDFEAPMRFTPVEPMGQHPPEISRAIHEESLEDQNYARNTGNDDDRCH